MKDITTQWSKIRRLRAINAKLLAALKQAEPELPFDRACECTIERPVCALNTVRAAIAEAEGG